MKSIIDFYFSPGRVFWAINFAEITLVVLLIGFIFQFERSEILIQLGIGIITTFVLVWILGGYKKLKQDYIKRQSQQRT